MPISCPPYCGCAEAVIPWHPQGGAGPSTTSLVYRGTGWGSPAGSHTPSVRLWSSSGWSLQLWLMPGTSAGKHLLPAASSRPELTPQRLVWKGPRGHRGFAPHLVVHHDVDGAMGGVGGQVTQVECLVHNALASKSGISMQEDGHHLRDVR